MGGVALALAGQTDRSAHEVVRSRQICHWRSTDGGVPQSPFLQAASFRSACNPDKMRLGESDCGQTGGLLAAVAELRTD